MTVPIKLFTIGFTKKPAEQFFTNLQRARVARVFDVRLNNRSQLAGFTKEDDLKFFLKAIGGIDYLPVPERAPTADILDPYKKEKGEWSVYEGGREGLGLAVNEEPLVESLCVGWFGVVQQPTALDPSAGTKEMNR